MPSKTLQSLVGGGGLPKINTAIMSTSRSIFGRVNRAGALATLSAGSSLTTILDITNKSAIQGLVLGTTSGATTNVVSRIIVTIDDDIWIDDTSVTMLASHSLWLIGSGYGIDTAVPAGLTGFGMFSGVYEFDTLKVELATIGGTGTTALFGSIEAIK